jgi:hypothetical protein
LITFSVTSSRCKVCRAALSIHLVRLWVLTISSDKTNASSTVKEPKLPFLGKKHLQESRLQLSRRQSEARQHDSSLSFSRLTDVRNELLCPSPSLYQAPVSLTAPVRIKRQLACLPQFASSASQLVCPFLASSASQLVCPSASQLLCPSASQLVAHLFKMTSEWSIPALKQTATL